MFLNYLKNIFTKKIVKKSLSNVKPGASETRIKTVGVLFEDAYFSGGELLIDELVANGIARSDIHTLVFKDRIKKNEIFNYPVFSYKDLSWQATFRKSEVRDFMETPFDLLINYYDVEKSALLVVTNLSKAKFKVGFAAVNKKLNHFMINTEGGNYAIFTEELFKYLKILNKL